MSLRIPIRHIRLVALKPFLWTLDKVWPFNNTTSPLGWPWCEAALSPRILDFGGLAIVDVCGELGSCYK